MLGDSSSRIEVPQPAFMHQTFCSPLDNTHWVVLHHYEPGLVTGMMQQCHGQHVGFVCPHFLFLEFSVPGEEHSAVSEFQWHGLSSDLKQRD